MGFINGIKKLAKPFSHSKSAEEDDDWYDKISDSGDTSDPMQADNWRWELFFDDVIANYVHSLRREKLNKKGEWVSTTEQPAVNEEGINFIMDSLIPILNKGTPLGHIKAKERKMKVSILTKTFKDKLILDGSTSFAIQKTNIPMIVFGYYHLVDSIISRSENDGERKIRSKMFGYNENYRHDEVNPDEIMSKKVGF